MFCSCKNLLYKITYSENADPGELGRDLKKINYIKEKYGIILLDNGNYSIPLYSILWRHEEVVKQDIAYLFNCSPEEIATSLKELGPNTKYVYIPDKDTLTRAAYLPLQNVSKAVSRCNLDNRHRGKNILNEVLKKNSESNPEPKALKQESKSDTEASTNKQESEKQEIEIEGDINDIIHICYSKKVGNINVLTKFIETEELNFENVLKCIKINYIATLLSNSLEDSIKVDELYINYLTISILVAIFKNPNFKKLNKKKKNTCLDIIKYIASDIEKNKISHHYTSLYKSEEETSDIALTSEFLLNEFRILYTKEYYTNDKIEEYLKQLFYDYNPINFDDEFSEFFKILPILLEKRQEDDEFKEAFDLAIIPLLNIPNFLYIIYRNYNYLWYNYNKKAIVSDEKNNRRVHLPKDDIEQAFTNKGKKISQIEPYHFTFIDYNKKTRLKNLKAVNEYLEFVSSFKEGIIVDSFEYKFASGSKNGELVNINTILNILQAKETTFENLEIISILYKKLLNSTNRKFDKTSLIKKFHEALGVLFQAKKESQTEDNYDFQKVINLFFTEMSLSPEYLIDIYKENSLLSTYLNAKVIEKYKKLNKLSNSDCKVLSKIIPKSNSPEYRISSKDAYEVYIMLKNNNYQEDITKNLLELLIFNQDCLEYYDSIKDYIFSSNPELNENVLERFYHQCHIEFLNLTPDPELVRSIGGYQSFIHDILPNYIEILDILLLIQEESNIIKTLINPTELSENTAHFIIKHDKFLGKLLTDYLEKKNKVKSIYMKLIRSRDNLGQRILSFFRDKPDIEIFIDNIINTFKITKNNDGSFHVNFFTDLTKEQFKTALSGYKQGVKMMGVLEFFSDDNPDHSRSLIFNPVYSSKVNTDTENNALDCLIELIKKNITICNYINDLFDNLLRLLPELEQKLQDEYKTQEELEKKNGNSFDNLESKLFEMLGGDGTEEQRNFEYSEQIALEKLEKNSIIHTDEKVAKQEESEFKILEEINKLREYFHDFKKLIGENSIDWLKKEMQKHKKSESDNKALKDSNQSEKGTDKDTTEGKSIVTNERKIYNKIILHIYKTLYFKDRTNFTTESIRNLEEIYSIYSDLYSLFNPNNDTIQEYKTSKGDEDPEKDNNQEYKDSKGEVDSEENNINYFRNDEYHLHPTYLKIILIILELINLIYTTEYDHNSIIDDNSKSKLYNEKNSILELINLIKKYQKNTYSN